MSNIKKPDIDTYQTYWQKLIAIDPDFKDIFIPPTSDNKKTQVFWYKKKFEDAYHWAKCVKLRPFEYGKEVTKKAKKIVKLVDEMICI